MDAGEILPMVPLPVRETTCGLPVALSVTVTVPLAVPFTCGENVTEIVQLPATARLAPQVLVCANPLLAFMLVSVTVAVPVLVSVTVWAGLVVPLNCVLKVRLVGDKDTVVAADAITPEKADTVASDKRAHLPKREPRQGGRRRWRRSPDVYSTDLPLNCET